MQNLKYRLTCAHSLIEDFIGSHQGGPEFAARYALEQLVLPEEAEDALIEYAQECERNLLKSLRDN